MPAKHEDDRPEWVFLAALLLINLLAKGAFLNINLGEYTDGVLQLTVFENKAGLYPPLYGGLAHAVSVLGVSLETAGRVVSLLAAVLCVLPVYWLGMRLGGGSAARIATLLYTVSPMPWRWSVRVMTDSLYLLLSTVVVVLLMESWIASRRMQDRESFNRGVLGQDDQRDLARNRAIAGRCLAGAVVCGALAVLTRYQGILLAPLIGLVGLVYVRRFCTVPWLAVVACAAWLLLPAWTWHHGFVHQGQFTSRTAPTLLATITAWWNTFESFVLIAPYYLGYPVVLMAVVGAMKHHWTVAPGFSRRSMFIVSAWLWGLYALMLLGLHAMFGSFQYRYMMPALPIFCALAGVGFSWLEERVASRRWIFSAALLVAVVYLVVLSFGVLVLQREAFGDQREAAAFIRDNVPPETPVYSNERYGAFVELGSVKLSYWSGRPVKTLVDPQVMEPGAVLALGTAYGGDDNVAILMDAVSNDYVLRALTPQPFRSQITPLMDDIMTNPMFNQNPLGWVLRYVPQNFATQLFVVQPRAGGLTDGS